MSLRTIVVERTFSELLTSYCKPAVSTRYSFCCKILAAYCWCVGKSLEDAGRVYHLTNLSISSAILEKVKFRPVCEMLTRLNRIIADDIDCTKGITPTIEINLESRSKV